MSFSAHIGERASLLTNVGYLFGDRGLGSLMRAGYALFLAAMLGPELYGLFYYGLSWYLAFLPLGIWGMTAFIGREMGREVGREVGRDSAEGVRRLLEVTLGLRIITSVLAAALCLGLTVFADAADTRLVAAGFALALVGRSLAVWTNDVLVARGRSGRVFRLQSPLRLLEVVAGVCALYAGLGLWGVLWIHSLSWWLQAGLGLAVVRRESGAFSPVFSLGAMLRIIRHGVPLTLLGFATGWLQQGPVVFAGQGLLGRAELGQLALAMQVYLLAATLIGAMASAALPLVSRAAADGQRRGVELAVWIAKLAMLYGAVAALAGGLLGPWLLELLFVGRYAQAGVLLGSVLWMLVLAAVNLGFTQVLLAHQHDYTAMGCSLAGALALVAGIVPLVTAFGPLGAILAAALGQGIRGLLAIGMLYLREQRTLLPELGRPLVLIGLVFVGVHAGQWFNATVATVATVIALALLLGGWFRWVLNAEQRSAFFSVFRLGGNH